MCGICGCADGAEATVTELGQTGEHVHADGTRHSHGHDQGHDHGDGHHHDHPDEPVYVGIHDHVHAHDHEHEDGTRHVHGHIHDHAHAHDGSGGGGEHEHVHEHGHPDGTRHSHDHGHSHAHVHDHMAVGHGHDHDRSPAPDHGHDALHAEMPAATVALETRILAKNDGLAAKNRAWFAAREILALNLVSSPGAGKTSLLERTIRDLGGALPIYVIEGDQATSNDGERIRAAGAPAVQVNTGTGCHLEADMVARGLAVLKPVPGAVVMIENVGNLVCPSMFDLGEHAKVAILSVTEGEDKPLKYPHMFKAASVMVLNKIDLLPYLDFDVRKAIAAALKVNPEIIVYQVSAKTGEGLEAWYGWLRRQQHLAGEAAFAGLAE